MKITKRELKQMINEAVNNALNEDDRDEHYSTNFRQQTYNVMLYFEASVVKSVQASSEAEAIKKARQMCQGEIDKIENETNFDLYDTIDGGICPEHQAKKMNRK